MVKTSLDSERVERILRPLSDMDEFRQRRYPGARPGRQPVHTCYVPADKVDSELIEHWGKQALSALDHYAVNPDDLASEAGFGSEFAEAVHTRVRSKLEREPIEDLRIDFEDGYGVRSDEQEDAEAVRTAGVLANWINDDRQPPYFGLRLKSFDTPELRARSVRTLDVFLTALMEALPSGLPEGFILTFPKIIDVREVQAFVAALELLEDRFELERGALRFELQVETAQSIVDSDGQLALPRFITAGDGRVSGLHFGTYDYTACCGLSPTDQHLAHRACDFARHVMQVSASGTGIALSDGSTNVLPVGDHESVRHGWRTHYRLVRRSIEHGFFQGWDLHPAQLITRYAAVYSAFLDDVQENAARLSAYAHAEGGSVLDEPATAQALAESFLRALDSGATDADEVRYMTGLSVDDLHSLAAREWSSVKR